MQECLFSISSFKKLRIIGVLLLLACLDRGLAEDTLTVDFPILSPLTKLPEGLAAAPQQVTSPDGIGYTEFSLSPMPEDQDLLVTIVFKETGGKGPALYWMSDSGQVMLSADLAEGVSGANQRSIQVPPVVSSLPGRLIVQGRSSDLLRVRLDWVALRKVFAAMDQRPVAFILSDRFLQNTELTGEKPLSPPDIWFGKTLEASLQEAPESLAESLEFSITVDKAVSQAVFNARILGLPLDGALEVWINGRRAGRLQPDVPSLTDPGYLKDASEKIVYAGWRSASLFVPEGLLVSGENSITIAAPGGEVFIRDAALQLESGKEKATTLPPVAEAAP